MNTISTKKNIGDVVWFMNNNKPIYGTIIEIRHNVYLNDVNYETIIISPNSADVYNIKTIRATEGMLYKINIVIKDLNEIIPDLKNKGYKIVGTDVQKGSHPYKISGAHTLIIGSEAKGMSDDVKKVCDEFFYIPMSEKCESLNAGVSASILMYTQL